MVKIIVNADDFGKSPERNRAIDDAFKQGIISSAGLIVTGKYLPDALRYIDEGGYADRVHLHLNLLSNLVKEGSEDAPLTVAMKNDPAFCRNGQFVIYKHRPRGLRMLGKWRLIYDEIVAQYEKFNEVTDGKGDLSHIDFHLWYNLTLSVAIALHFFTKRYPIKSARFLGEHQKGSIRNRFYGWLSSNRSLTTYPATNIDYFLSKPESFREKGIVELYCHPDYKEDVWFDNSPSYLKHERQPMLRHIELLSQMENVEYISWRDIKNGRYRSFNGAQN